jgi:WD40 repeat protein
VQVQARGTNLVIASTESASTRALAFPIDITRVAVSPDNATLAIVCENQIHLMGLRGSERRVLEHEAPVVHVEFSPDGTRLVAATADKTLEKRSARLWDVPSGKPVVPPLFHDDGVLDATFSADGSRIATSSEDFSAGIWDARTGQPLCPRLRHRDKVRSTRFAETHPWVVTASDDGSAVVWDASSGEPLSIPLTHTAHLRSAVFADRDSAIITTDVNGQQWRWDLAVDRKSVSNRPAPHSSK